MGISDGCTLGFEDGPLEGVDDGEVLGDEDGLFEGAYVG